MTVTEVLHQPGEWTLPLRPDAPAEIRRALRIDTADAASIGHGWLVVTSQRVDHTAYPAPASPSTTVHPLCAAARWAGLVEEVGGRHNELKGRGLLGALGRGSRGEYATQLVDSTISGTGAQLAQFLLNGTSRTITGGLNAGSSTSIGASAALRTGTLGTWPATCEIGGVLANRKDLLRFVAESTGNAFRVRSTGQVDLNVASTLWGTNPQVLFSPTPPVTESVAHVALGVGDRSDSLAEWANAVVGDPAGAPGNPWFTGTAPGDVWSPGRGASVRWEQQSDPGQDETFSVWEDRADVLAASTASAITTYEINGPPSNRSLIVEPGELAWLHDPEIGLEDTANTLVAGVDVLHPKAVRLRAVTWPFVEGMGVYLLYVDRTGFTTVQTVDLTNWVAWEQDDAWTWEIGALAPWRNA